MTDAAAHPLRIALADEAATGRAAQKLAEILKVGDIVALAGELGAGKTAFARALINALPGDLEDVPSPTFTLVQTYRRGALEVWHFDLYRLQSPDEALELGIDDAFAGAISLIEWPDRLGPYLPRRHLRATLSQGGESDARVLTLSGDEAWRARLAGTYDEDAIDGNG